MFVMTTTIKAEALRHGRSCIRNYIAIQITILKTRNKSFLV